MDDWRGEAIIIIIVISYSYVKRDLAHLYLGRDISTHKRDKLVFSAMDVGGYFITLAPCQYLLVVR